VKLVHLDGFITKKSVMMHGHVNLKKLYFAVDNLVKISIESPRL